MAREKLSKKKHTKPGNEKNRLKGIEKVHSRDLLKDLNKEFEIARLKKVNPKERLVAINKIYNACKGKFVKLCYKRNSAKIIQCLIKYSDREMTDTIFDELKTSIPDIITKPYGKFVIEKFYEKDNKYKVVVLEMVKKNIKRIITDRIGIDFLDDLYFGISKKKRWDLLMSLTGKEVELFYENKDMPIEKVDVESITRKMIGKGLVNFEVAHDLISLHFEAMRARNASCFDLLNVLSDSVPDFLFTKNGLAIANEILNENMDKQEKIIESLVPFLLKIASDEFGSQFLVAVMEKCEENITSDKIVKNYLNRFEDIFINEHSVILLEYLMERGKVGIKKEMVDFMNENFTDFVRNHNFGVLYQFVEKNEELKNKAIKLITDHKENKILSNEFAERFYKKADDNKLIDVRKILGNDYEKLIKSD